MRSIKWSYFGRLAGEVSLFFLILMDVRTILMQDSHTMLLQYSDDSTNSSPNETSEFNANDGQTNRYINSESLAESHDMNLQYKSRLVLRQYLLRHRLIPEVLAVAPAYLMEVRYTRRCVVNLGNKVDPSLLQKRPRQIVWPAQNDTLYTLLLVDADVPSRSNRRFSQRQHWIVMNIPGLVIWKGDEVVEYMGPLAPPHTGMHRYVFAVFKQYGRLEYDGEVIKATADKLSSHRLYFNMRNFSDKYRLRDPIAVNFYLSGWPLDQYVPVVDMPTNRPSWFVTSEPSKDGQHDDKGEEEDPSSH